MQSLLQLALPLACPVGTGLMMWMMMRVQRRGDASAAAKPVSPVSDTAAEFDAW